MPTLTIIAGPNGAGKTTASQTLLPHVLQYPEFVNADAIAAGLSPYHPESVALEAGRLMLKRINYLAAQKVDFAIETTLATRSYAPLIRKLRAQGYQVDLLFIYLKNSAEARKRVAFRVAMGGHNIPTEDIDRRYHRGLTNLFNLYLPIVDSWGVWDNTLGVLDPIAKQNSGVQVIVQAEKWSELQQEFQYDNK